jgi:hypothetical protein
MPIKMIRQMINHLGHDFMYICIFYDKCLYIYIFKKNTSIQVFFLKKKHMNDNINLYRSIF